MILAAATVLALAARCAPAAAPETLLAIARAESGLNPLAIGVVRGAGATPQPLTREAAIAAAQALAAQGASFDLGLTQINSANLTALGLSFADAFDPCRSLAAAAQVLSADYRRAKGAAADDQAALRIALSLYNTGDPNRGFRNGYVARVEAGARVAASTPTSSASELAPWDVFARARTGFVLTLSSYLEGALP
jgi:type IV secretion system protein VirB1